ncbi:MAG: hypothetical protein NT007_02500 [Candidatus Kapabacteria bacterium]|nr:hypothetical protein [Candidatus Kapabacteria bacterium]
MILIAKIGKINYQFLLPIFQPTTYSVLNYILCDVFGSVIYAILFALAGFFIKILALCQGSCTQLTALSSNITVKYQWNGPNTSANDTTKFLQIFVPGTYILQILDSSGCTASAQTEVKELYTNLAFSDSYEFGKNEIFIEKDTTVELINNSVGDLSVKSVKLKKNKQFKIKNPINLTDPTNPTEIEKFLIDN